MRTAALCVLVAASALPRRARRIVVGMVLIVWSPLLGIVAVASIGALHAWRRLQERRDSARRLAAEVPLLGELVGLGLSAGRPFPAALAAAVPHLESPLADEVQAVVRQMARNGAAAALAAAGGSAARLYHLAGRALSTGAPLAAAVHAFTDEARAVQRTERLAAVRRLPVILMLPLALLILPGFVLLTVAPAVVGAVERIGL